MLLTLMIRFQAPECSDLKIPSVLVYSFIPKPLIEHLLCTRCLGYLKGTDKNKIFCFLCVTEGTARVTPKATVPQGQ